ncbi:MAG: response regulator transcription factor [Drouetiella hepatica Uher 2000/2452]|uniref:Response regulator transcription factor n=1 Tax=Drouetiella hepatica Uher 2000/2452 TaxID=904376 RepID=A0A951Q8T2_9CYAN|nr:response regulator transcription factor [Drouetiella hepatica Uher 2000/2452]
MQAKCFSPQHTPSETGSAHIFVIESDDKIAQLIRLELSYEGYHVDLCQDGTLGLMSIRETCPDLVILSSSSPGISYLEICQRLRATRSSTVIIAIAEDSSACVAALNAGADHCLVRSDLARSFALEELLAKIRAGLRRSQNAPSHLAEYGDLLVNRNARQIHLNGQEIELTATEFNLLDYLVEHSEQVMSRDQILEQVWGFDFMGKSNVVEVYIGYLRRKLEAQYPKRLIHTVRSIGYVLR